MDTEALLDKHNERWNEADKKNEKLGEGLVEGKIVTFPVADGKAAYEIVEIGDEISRVEYRPDLCLDRYHSQAVSEDGKILTSTLESACNRMDYKIHNK